MKSLYFVVYYHLMAIIFVSKCNNELGHDVKQLTLMIQFPSDIYGCKHLMRNHEI